MKFSFRHHNVEIEIDVDQSIPDYAAVVTNLSYTKKRSALNGAFDGLLELLSAAAKNGLMTKQNKKLWQKVISETLDGIESMGNVLGQETKPEMF